MRTLQERLGQIQSEIAKLQAQEALILDMLREARGEPKVKPRAPRSNVKQAILDLLEEVGAEGLNAAIAVGLAERNGVNLERGSVSSILSRLKSDGAVTYDNERYRLTKYAQQATVHPIRTSGAVM